MSHESADLRDSLDNRLQRGHRGRQVGHQSTLQHTPITLCADEGVSARHRQWRNQDFTSVLVVNGN